MTTFDAAAAWQKKKPLIAALCASLMAFGLAGCETANSLTSSLFSSSGGEAPTASVANPPPMAATARGAQFAIAPVIGPPENVSGELRNQLIKMLNFMMNPEIHGESDIERARRAAKLKD